MDINSLSIIGTGKIGLPIAENLIKKKYKVSFFARKEKTIKHLENIGGVYVQDIRCLCKTKNILFVFLNNYSQCIECLSKIIPDLKQGIIIIGSTLAPEEILDIKNRYEKGNVKIISAPVSGGVKNAITGSLYSIVAGDKNVVEKIYKLIQAYSKKINYVGEDITIALKLKAINQLLVSTNNVAMCEAYYLAEKNGISKATLYEVVKNSSGNSYIWESRGECILNNCFEAKAAVNTILKDLDIIKNIMKKNKVSLKTFNSIESVYNDTKKVGYGESDIISVLKFLLKR